MIQFGLRMEGLLLLRVLVVLLLVAANAFFVAAEFALVSVRTTRVQQMIEAGRLGARTVERLQARLDDPEKNWKISVPDVKERACWLDYRKAYEEALTRTSTETAPWYIIPADNKWFMRAAVGDILVRTLAELKPEYPDLSGDKAAELARIKLALRRE